MKLYSDTHRTCHLEQNEVESRDLRTSGIFRLKSVRRSLDSLCSLGMTSFEGTVYEISI